FHSDLFREEYLFRSGRKAIHEATHVFSEYSDLFRLSAVDELRAKLKETAEYRETETKSIRRLIAFALENNLVARARAVSDEIEYYEAEAQITWDGERISFHPSADLLANEAHPQRRHDLYARRADVIQGAQDLRAERFHILHEGAQELGFENYVAMRRELRGVDCEKLLAQAEQILARTENRYVSALAPLLVREAGVSIDQATAADLGWLQRYAHFDAFFGREQMPRMYRDLFVAPGFDIEKQSNVEIDSTHRPNKQSQAFCSPIEVPDEIKLVVNFMGGQSNYGEFLRAAGRVQHFAWTSRNLYPEFRIGGDAAVGEAWGLLFENLLLEPAWLAGTFGFVENAEFRHALAVLRLMAVRRQAAKLIYEAEFHAGKLSNGAGPRYAELMTAAVRVRFDEAESFSDVSDDFHSANYLRAAAFEVQMRDHLKTQFGSRWWASGKAGEMLIDLWNTGQRHSVEELAAMIGLGELDFDCLTSELLNLAGA
ncbi:MAG: hypothetical protein ABI977_37640, partial [Acidobacteriota bacterium]